MPASQNRLVRIYHIDHQSEMKEWSKELEEIGEVQLYDERDCHFKVWGLPTEQFLPWKGGRAECFIFGLKNFKEPIARIILVRCLTNLQGRKCQLPDHVDSLETWRGAKRSEGGCIFQIYSLKEKNLQEKEQNYCIPELVIQFHQKPLLPRKQAPQCVGRRLYSVASLPSLKLLRCIAQWDLQ